MTTQLLVKRRTQRTLLSLAGAVLAVALAFMLSGCSGSGESSESTSETITIQALNGSGETADIEVPYDPQRIAILDMACLDILDNLGLGERVVGSASTSIDYLQDYVTNENIANLGTIKEADLEAVAAAEPDIIFIGGRLSASYDDLAAIAPVVYIATDTEKGLVQSVNDNATTIASIFGLESEVEEKMSGFNDRIAALQEVANGHTTLVTMYTSSSVNVLGNDGRCSIIGSEIGFDNLAAGETTSTHGNETSFETIVQQNPEYIFVLNRDAAIGTDGADQAQEIVENSLTQNTQAYQDGNIIYLEHPAVWYTAEGGITALDTMLSDLEGALL